MNQEFISENRNDSFTSLRGFDLQDLLVQTENYFLEYRNKLGLPDDLTFGTEIEYEGILKLFTDLFIKRNLKGWCSKSDGSLVSGGEITSPVMTDKVEYWGQLKKVCNYLTRRGADTSRNAGGHVHIGASTLGNDIAAWKQFLKLYTAYENVLFRFVYGDKISARKKLFRYASPIADSLYENLEQISCAKTLSDITLIVGGGRYQSLNFCNVKEHMSNGSTKNTLEFRCPNATTNAIIWQNNINTLAKMLVSAKKKVMNEEFLDYKLKHEFYTYSSHNYLYNIINLKSALEFVDLIFDNNLDKIYFLRQYLKDFQDGYGIRMAVKAKNFVR